MGFQPGNLPTGAFWERDDWRAQALSIDCYCYRYLGQNRKGLLRDSAFSGFFPEGLKILKRLNKISTVISEHATLT